MKTYYNPCLEKLLYNHKEFSNKYRSNENSICISKYNTYAKKIIYRDIYDNKRKLRFTLPTIDKIRLVGTTDWLSVGETIDEQIASFFAHLKSFMTIARRNLAKLEYANPRGTGFSSGFKICLLSTDAPIHLFVIPCRKKIDRTFIQLDFSMKNIGSAGLLELVGFFDELFPDCPFVRFADRAGCIKFFELSIDCIGLNANEIYAYVPDQKLCEISNIDGIETIYLNSRPGQKSKAKIYDKRRQLIDCGASESLETMREVTRFEVYVEPKIALSQLAKIKSTHFNKILAYTYILTDKNFPGNSKYFPAILAGIYSNQSSRVLHSLPKKIYKKYKCYLEKEKYLLLSDFSQRRIWRELWKESLNRMGVSDLFGDAPS